jgi:hypothetical protein
MSDQPRAPSRGPFSFSAQAGAPMPIDPPFDPNNAWWPNPGWPRSGPLGGPYPDDWTDPFINPRPIAPAAIAPFSAAQLGAMAWHPPIFPGDWASLPPSNFPGAGWPAPVLPAGSNSNNDLTAAPTWPDPQSPYLSPGPSAAPGAPRSRDNLGELLSRDPSFPLCFRIRSDQTRAQCCRPEADFSPQPARPRRPRSRTCPPPRPRRDGRLRSAHRPGNSPPRQERPTIEQARSSACRRSTIWAACSRTTHRSPSDCFHFRSIRTRARVHSSEPDSSP